MSRLFNTCETGDENEVERLFYACESGDESEVKRVVEECDVYFDIRCSYGWTPLMYACECGHISIVKYLVGCGANAEVQVPIGYYRTPLMCVCYHGHFEIVKYLVEECDVDVFVKNSQGKRASDMSQTEEIRDYLREIEDYTSLQKQV